MAQVPVGVTAALPTRQPGIALLAEFAEVLLAEHRLDEGGYCRACRLPATRCVVIGRAQEYGLAAGVAVPVDTYRPRHLTRPLR